MEESRKPQQQENLENLLMQLKINLARDDLDKINVPVPLRKKAKDLSPPFYSKILADHFSFIYTAHSDAL